MNQLFRVWLCSFCVDAPWAHQKWDSDITYIYIAPASWQVVKDYIANTIDCICARRPLTAFVQKNVPYPTQSLRIRLNGKIMSDSDGIDELL